jgi:4'-phosphopantetheinyl transferase
MPDHWPLAPSTLSLEPGQVNVFRLELDLPEPRLPGLFALLDNEERSRAGRLLRECDRRRFIAAHGQMRQALAAHLHCMPDELCFITNENGKPYLDEIGRLQFNLSHSKAVGLLAVALEMEIGIDIETVRDSVDYADIARHFFAPGEIENLFTLPPEQQLRAFFTCWTRKEAYMKARGLGLSIPLDSFEVTLAPDDSPRLLNHPDSENWVLYSLSPTPEHTAALAVPKTARPPVLYSWPPP